MREGDLIYLKWPVFARNNTRFLQALVLDVDVSGYETACSLLCEDGRVIDHYVSDMCHNIISTVEEMA